MRSTLALVFCLSLVLAGCSSGPATSSQPDASLARSGVVQGGQQPIVGASIQLYGVGTAGDSSAATALLTSPVQTDQSGNFNITSDYTCPSASTEVYLVATGGNPGLAAGTNNTAIAMMVALGPCGSLSASAFIFVDEVTTIGSLAALYPYMSSATHLGSGSGDSALLASAFALVSEYTNTTTGTAFNPEVNTLGNVVASCINSSGGIAGDGSPCGTLFALATPPSGQAPTDTVGALIYILNNPTQNVSALFGLSGGIAPFQPSLSTAPSNWILFPAANPTAPTFAVIPGRSVHLGQKMTSVDLSQYEQGGVPPLVYSIVSESSSQTVSTSLSGSVLQSDYAYHGGTNQVIVSATDANNASAQAIVTVTVPVPTVTYTLFGFDFSPYENGQDPNLGSQISADQITQRIGGIAPYVQSVRSFGVDHGLENIGCIAHKFGLKAYVGAWISTDSGANETGVQKLISLAKSGCVDYAIVGSEVLLRNDLSPTQLNSYIDEFRAAVPSVPVGTADTYSSFLNNPQVAANCDSIFANYYPFWEGQDISLAVADLNAEDLQLRKTYPTKEVVVSETGWPSGGSSVGSAAPSLANAAYYFLDFESWVQAGNRKAFYFDAEDEAWKALYGEGPLGATWGVFDQNGVIKYGQNVFAGQTVPDNWTCNAPPGGAGTPTLLFTYVPPKGSLGSVQGQEWHVAPSGYYVAVYIDVSGGWWTKPTFAQPDTVINCDGTFTANITTGGNDPQATSIAAFLLPQSYTAPTLGGSSVLPQDLYTNAVANTVVNR